MCWVNIVIPIVSSLLGGLLTLIGVAWTIKNNNRDRKSDFDRLEFERREEERKRNIPYIRLEHLKNVGVSVNTSFRNSLNFDNPEDLTKLTNNRFYCYIIKNFSVKNISKNCIILESIIVDGKEYIFSENKLVESEQSILVKTTGNYPVNSKTLLNSIQLKCKDLIENSYILDCKYKYKFSHDFPYFETEIDGIIYKGFNVEYTIDNIDLPMLVKEKN